MSVPRDHGAWIDWNNDKIIDRGMWCIFCREELIRSRWVPTHWRHLDNGFIICILAIQRGVWPRKRRPARFTCIAETPIPR